MNVRSILVTGFAVVALSLSACGTKATTKNKANQNGQFGAFGNQTQNWNNSGWNTGQWQNNGWNYNPGGQYGMYNYAGYSSLMGYWYAPSYGYMYINPTGSMFWLGGAMNYTTGMVPNGYVMVNGGLSLNLNLKLGNPFCGLFKKRCCGKPVYKKPCCNPNPCGGGNPTDFPPPGDGNPTAMAAMGDDFGDGLRAQDRGQAGMSYDNARDQVIVNGIRFQRAQ